ncbi:hypothetical protein [Polyangium sp. y55x31]|uniref:hypothetical protein n=1 Tax=Polyangium sp. y55x31 TaxID=3042688 RepID=UPI002482D6C0|nr:hypothetical protein [Polyangium sp. y55x31]MDI1476790.1 hypothetical protein [Polyangium sp. y55x31]
MKHSPEELSELARQFYPPLGIYPYQPEYKETAEIRRLTERRQQAVANYLSWRSFLDRLSQRLPECGVANKVMYLAEVPEGACYAADLWLPTIAKEVGGHAITFHVSFLAPCYVLHSGGFHWRDEVDSVGCRLSTPWEERFDLTPEEQPYAEKLVQEIVATFPEYELMPPDIGYRIVPDLQHENRVPGAATIYDCLINDHWIPRKQHG